MRNFRSRRRGTTDSAWVFIEGNDSNFLGSKRIEYPSRNSPALRTRMVIFVVSGATTSMGVACEASGDPSYHPPTRVSPP